MYRRQRVAPSHGRQAVIRHALRGSYLASVVLATSPTMAADLRLSVQGIEAAQGTLRIAVYASEADFRENMLRSLALPAAPGTMSATFEDLSAGEYAVMLYQDLNDNEEIDTNLLGIPKEPWGGSLNGTQVLGPPDWADVKFSLPAGGSDIQVLLR